MNTLECKLRTIAYQGIGPESGRYIRIEDAIACAMRRCGIRWASTLDEQADFQEAFACALLDWFYSGNWIAVKEKP